MSDSASKSVRRPEAPLSQSLTFKSAALMIVAALGILLWAAAIPQLTGIVTRFGASVEHDATVSTCPTGVLTQPCVVSFPSSAGPATHPVTRPITRPGLIGVQVGDQVPIWVTAGGEVIVAGWRPYLDCVVLIALAVAITSYTIRLWRRVLRHGSPSR